MRGTAGKSLRARTTRSIPSTSGMAMSATSTSARSHSMRGRAFTGSVVVTTRQGSLASMSFTSSRIQGSSSTTSTVGSRVLAGLASRDPFRHQGVLMAFCRSCSISPALW